jgi:large subunit ribosomal protein L4
MITLPVYNVEGKEIDTIKLDEKYFSGKLNTSPIYQVITNYRANQRAGTASTKTRGEVSGGGKKPWKQKGTGRARVGSSRNPLWRHGGVVFGPHPRDFSYSVPKKIKQLALSCAITAKALDKSILVLDSFSVAEAKTRVITGLLKNFKIDNKKTSTLLIVKSIDDNMKRAGGNIANLTVKLARTANTYEIVSARRVMVTRDALETLIERVKAKK